MNGLPTWPIAPLVAAAIPVTLALGGALLPRRATALLRAAFLLASLFAVVVFGAYDLGRPASDFGVRVDALTALMLVLVTSLGAIVARFSENYLGGDTGRRSERWHHYQRWLLFTLSAVTTLVVSNNLLVMAASWTATSLALHQLLTLYEDREAAQVAAHKKFLVSRLADLALAPALLLVYSNVGSFELDVIAAWLSAESNLPLSMQVAAALLVSAVALRSAQLPFHGWITQVMEAPTPVSALLHAGVVNIGGFVLIRLAPWISRAEPAQLLLVAIGLTSTIAAALVMMTRVSVKVALAWSTCAQMGFLLVQCGLGLWPLAFLHIVAHSLYKAHAFLSAGGAVEAWETRVLTKRPATIGRQILEGALSLLFAGAALLGATLLQSYWGAKPAHWPTAIVLTLLVGLSLPPLMSAPRSPRIWSGVALRMLVVVALYFGWHAAAERLVPTPTLQSSSAGLWLVGLGFVGLFITKSTIALRPNGAFARALHPWLFSGLYLDDFLTRLMFRVWPPHLPRPKQVATRALSTPAALEVQSS
ncbi:MAG: NADH-quinone oxidoreductase subunit L [Polyangiaceae bacterium]